MTYTYTESNGTTGGTAADRAISSVSISDDKCSPVAGVDTALPVAGFNDGDANKRRQTRRGRDVDVHLHVKTALQCGRPVTNTATATGTDALGATVTWCPLANARRARRSHHLLADRAGDGDASP